MILIYALCVVDTAIELGHVVLGEADERLNIDEDVEGEAEAGVGRGKVFVAWTALVDFDDDEAGG